MVFNSVFKGLSAVSRAVKLFEFGACHCGVLDDRSHWCRLLARAIILGAPGFHDGGITFLADVGKTLTPNTKSLPRKKEPSAVYIYIYIFWAG